MKKLLSIILVGLMVATMIPMAVLPASAATEAAEVTDDAFITYSDGVTQYLKHDNYLYKVTFTNLKNTERLSFVIQYDYLRIKPQDSGITNLLANDGSTNLKKSDLPNSEGGVLNCYSTNTKRVIDTNKPIVIITCMAVNEPVWSWGDSSATAAFTSTDGKATMTVTAAIESSEQTAATCLENDKTTYTATATANGKAYTNEKTVDGEQGPHSFEYSGDDVIGRCTNGCGYECPHENQTGVTCEICGAVLHLCSYDNGFCTECDAYEPAELKDGYYQIKNGGQLFWYANYINTVDRTANAVLTADIDLENRPWTPIGSTGENSNNFRGIFDGQYYNIKGLYVEGDRAGLGFFGEVRTGTVKNFIIFGEVVVNTEVDYVGGVIGSICGVNGETDLERNGAIIQNINSYVNLTVKAHGVGKIGGFVGYANHQSLIEHCAWYGTFDAGEYRVDSGAGGFIGKIQENSSEVTIRNCAAYGTIKTNYAGDYNDTATIYMGGFLSFSNTNAKTTLENCLFAGKFERGENLTDQAFLGAFGTLRSVNAIKNCYYLGDDGLEAVHSDSNLKPGSDNVEITKVTEEQLKSGEIAYKLQEENEIWGQSIGTDAYPVLGGEDVYCGYTACDDEAMVYTNDSTVSATKPDHAWGEGSLTRPTKTQDGYYTYTCSACGETKTEPVLRAANYDDYTKALEDLRAYLDSDMLTDENKSNISVWLATYDTDEAYGFIAGEEETVQMYIDATAYYASEFKAAIEDCLAGNHSGNGETCSVCGATIKFATITGVSINIDGVIYTSDNTSAENPAVIHPDSIVTFTVTGENFDLLPADLENAVIGFTYFSQNMQWLYNNPSKFDIDTVNNTVSFLANYNVLPQATTASELTYTNDGWYTDIGSGVYVIYIDKKDIADTLITLDNTEFIYSGNPIEPTILVMADGQALMEGEHYTLTFESNVNAGTASVTVKGIGDYTGEVTKDFTITKAYYNLTAPTPNTLAYNGEEQYLVSAGTVEGADFEYSLDGASWSTSIPQAKDVGNYTVYYRVLADENHYDVEGTVDVTIKECAHEWNDGVLTRPVYDAVLGSKDGYYTYTCTLCGEEKTEAVKSANYSAYEAVSEEINALLQSDDLTSEAKQAIYSAANECGLPSNDLTESEQNIVDDLVAELEEIVADAEEKIASGEYVKADYTEIDEAIKAIDEALENATISEEMANEFSDIKSQLEALKVNENTSMADAAELLERVKAVAQTMADCAKGVHSFTKYEEVTAPKCGKTGLEKADCDHGCGATDENEIPALTHEPLEAVKENEVAPKCGVAGSYDLVVYCDLCGDELDRDTVTVDALTHKDEDGDYLCDHGCGHEFPKPVEPEQPDTPDTPDEPTDDTCDHICHSNNALMKVLWKIIRFFYRLFNIQQYCDCGVIHYDAPVFG